MDTAERWIGRGEALARLGVKTQTLYAYVSRGRIAARPDPADPRRSLYAVQDVARLTGADAVSSAAPRMEGAPARGQAMIQSSLTLIEDGRLFYRGLDAAQLSQTATLEDAARLLWDARDTDPFAGLKPRLAVGGVSARVRLFAALSRRAEEDAPSTDRPAAALRLEAASVLNEVVDAVAGPGPRLHFHQRLGRAFKVVERDSALIRRALVLAMDHDLSAATITTRVAAGGGASPAGAALAGLMALSGSEEMQALVRASALVQEARRDPAGVIQRHLRQGGTVPGFASIARGQPDPRAAALIAALDLPRDLAAVIEHGEAATGQRADFGLALALAARRLDLPRDGAADILMIGRLTGLLAHALDQAIDGSPIAARLRYVGPRPGAH